jgi:MFS family permease
MPRVAATFVRWMYLRALFHQGYWLVTSLYLVVDAHLSAFQLVFLGTVMGLTLMLSDIPAGVWADSIGRKWPLVIAHLLLGAGMVMTGVVTAFPLLLVTQVLWGLGWAFFNGADVAWITDELDLPDRIARVLSASARWSLAGAATGIVAFGMLGWATSLATAIIVSGIGMALLGLFVVTRFTEQNFTPAHERRWSASLTIFRRGVTLARRDHEILLVFAATMIINGASEVGRLFPKQLVDLGVPTDPNPVFWFTALGILSLAVGVVALRIVEARIDGIGVARRTYALACLVGLLGLIVLGRAPNALTGGVGILLVSGIAFSVTRTVSVIWVNRRTTSDVRATVHSFLSQAESVGEILGGFGLAVLAQTTSIATALMTAGGFVAGAGAMVARSRADR